ADQIFKLGVRYEMVINSVNFVRAWCASGCRYRLYKVVILLAKQINHAAFSYSGWTGNDNNRSLSSNSIWPHVSTNDSFNFGT
ncbi:MAG: hypothetical protein VX289_10630, partial [Candidatus Poribacteria bacterium]|nr:hypothetical protein [Candidatus Poribacteria bacterium]